MQGARPPDVREQHRAQPLDLVEDGVVGTDTTFCITSWNRGAERLYGISAAEVVGRPASEVALFPSGDERARLRRDLAESGRVRAEFTAVRPDGTTVDVELVVTAVRGGEGEVCGYLGVHRDITERRQAAGRLARQARDDERQRIARALHDEALQDVRYALARAERPPDGAEPDGPLVAALTRVARQLRAAVYDLRPSDDERSFEEQLTTVVEQHRRMAPELRIELDLDEQGSQLPRRIRGEVARIVGEALTNGRRHAGAGRVVVRAWTSGEDLRCEVADDGCGVTGPPGHGMAGMHERAERLGGEVVVRSPETGGTVVRVRVPLAHAGAAGAPARVLLVEDHAAVREAIAAALRREPDVGVVREAATLAQARGMLHDLDVALVDLGLPDGDGGDLIAELRDVAPEAHAIVLSASLDRSVVARAVERGAAGALSKADRLPDVIDAIRRVRAGETLLPLEEVVELLRFASREREHELTDRRAIESLTSRELEVLQLIADGYDSRQAAARLHITVRTQRNHVANVLAKLGVHSQLQALIFALRHRLVQLRSTAC